MSHRPADFPREPYRALAAFLVLPLAAAAVGAWRAPTYSPAGATPVAGHVGASLGAPLAGAPAGPAIAAPARAPSRPRPPAAR